MKLTRNLLGLSIAITSLSVPAIALGQQSSRAIEEIVVTSRRKDESLQDVPLSVTAFGAERIEQIKPTTLRDFDGLAPNVYIGMNTAGPSASSLYIRGVGYADIEKTQSPQVGVIVDGIQLGSSTGQLVDVFDVESIEINRGPQGVLFGKNTIGGNMVVNRVRPQLDDWGLNASVEAGNYNSRSYKVRVNVPLVKDELALKIGAIQRERDGYYDNITLNQTAGDVDFTSYTIALRWAPTPSFDAVLSLDWIDDQSQIPPQDPRYNGDDPFVNESDKEEPTTYDVDQMGLRFSWEIADHLTLHSITGKSTGEDQVNQDFDGTHIGATAIPLVQLHTLRTQTLEVFSQELRLVGEPTDGLDYMLGYYYYDSELAFEQKSNSVNQLPAFALPAPFVATTPPMPHSNCAVDGIPPGFPPGVLVLRNNPVVGGLFCQFPNGRATQLAGEDVTSKAIFASLTWQPTDRLEILVGARRIEEKKAAFNSYFDHATNTYDDKTVPGYNEFDFTNLPAKPTLSYRVSDDWSATIVTGSLSYAIGSASNLYVNYSEGFRSGGFSIRSARLPSEAVFQPEEADQIEFGVKNDLFGGRLSLNLAYYQLTLEDGQFSSIIVQATQVPASTTIINNADESVYKGWELESRLHLGDDWTLLLNGGTVDTDNKAYSRPCDIIDGCETGVPGVLNPPGTLRQRGGHDDSRQPDWSMSASIAFSRGIGPGTFFANVGFKKVGGSLLVGTGGTSEQRVFERGYAQWDARLAYDLSLKDGSSVSVSIYGRNLGDEEWREQALLLGPIQNSGFQGWGAPSVSFVELRYAR